MSGDIRLEEILVNRKRQESFRCSAKNPPDRALLDRTVTLDGLLKVLGGRTALVPVCLLTLETKGARLEEFLRTLFQGTDLAAFGEGELSGSENKLTALRHGRHTFYSRFRESGFPNSPGGVTVWEQTRAAFCAAQSEMLRQVEENLPKVLDIRLLGEDAAAGIHRVFCFVQGLDEGAFSPSLSVCLREIAMLAVQSLLEEDVCTRESQTWVESGECFDRRPDERPGSDPLARYFGSGIFALRKEEIREELLPDVSVWQDNQETVFRLNKEAGGISVTPLGQVLEHNREENLFLLCGAQESGVSGAGKSTSLRRLYYDAARGEKGAMPIFVPLSSVYSASGLRDVQKEQGRPRLLTWLELQGRRYESLEKLDGRLVLMDGLDEITDGEGLRSLCDDLRLLSARRKLRVVISSKQPPEKLGAWEELKNIASVWNRCRQCYIQPLRPEQKRAYLRREDEEMALALKSPFLLRMYENVQSFLREEDCATRELFFRWVAPERLEEPADSESALFYRYLAAQICRWFDANRGGDGENEADAFFLMYALPAVAFHMEMGEIYDKEYVPELPAMDEAGIKSVLDQSFSMFRGALGSYPAYRGSWLEALMGSVKRLDHRGLFGGRAALLLCGELDRKKMVLNYRFVSHAVQENLAALHLANLFFAAWNGALAEEVSAFCYLCPIYFLPKPMLKKAARFVDELFGEGFWCENHLSGPIPEAEGALERCLRGSIAAGLCAALDLPGQSRWRRDMEEGYELLEASRPELARQYRIDHVLNLCELSRLLRKEEPVEAIKTCEQAIAFYKANPEVNNSDGYHYLAMTYLEHIEAILNQSRGETPDEGLILPVGEERLDFARRVLERLRELSSALERGERLSAADPVFGALPPRHGELVRPLLSVLEKAHLRLARYEREDFFGSAVTEFLLKASFAAKAHSVYAAMHRGCSGASMNLLSSFLENQQEQLENHRELAFFLKYPHLRLDIPDGELEYPDNHVGAFVLCRTICNVRRGSQSYSAKKAAQALLARRVRLDRGGRVLPGPGEAREFNKAELDALEKLTTHACIGQRKNYCVPRIRFLNERMATLSPFDRRDDRERRRLAEEAGRLFRQAWQDNQWGRETDINVAMLMGEYSPGYLDNPPLTDWESALRKFFRAGLGLTGQRAPVKYALGTRQQKLLYLDCCTRLCRLGEWSPVFRIGPESGNSKWNGIWQALSETEE